ncbi:MAG: MmgE/PrpD family protein, partial [Nitriliruptoraceae bacterium]
AGLAIAHVLATASAPAAFERWSAAGTIGKIAATAAAGRLCGLDERHLTFAIGIATTGVAGLAGAAGTPRAATIAGNAAADAVAAALLAERGLTAPGELLVGTNSFSEVLGFALDAGVITDGLDSSAATVRGILDGPDHADARLHAAEEALAGRLGASSAELFLADAMSTESQSVADLVGRLVARMGR